MTDHDRIALAGGTFTMGTDDPVAYPADGEGPAIEVTVDPFAIDVTAVTVRQFARFVEATGWRSDAEQFGWSFVFGGLLPDDFEDTMLAELTFTTALPGDLRGGHRSKPLPVPVVLEPAAPPEPEPLPEPPAREPEPAQAPEPVARAARPKPKYKRSQRKRRAE